MLFDSCFVHDKWGCHLKFDIFVLLTGPGGVWAIATSPHGLDAISTIGKIGATDFDSRIDSAA